MKPRLASHHESVIKQVMLNTIAEQRAEVKVILATRVLPDAP